MKRIILLLAITTLSFFSATAQGNRYLDSLGHFKYQYNRSMVIDPNNPRQAIVSFVFINGDEQTGISYRQEVLNSQLSWIKTDKGVLKREKLVETITANLEPKETLVWKFTIVNKPSRKDGKVTIEKGALLLINNEFIANKFILEEQKCGIK